MSERFLLGVDIGTYESKGVITTVDGRIVSRQVQPHQMIIPRQGWAEHDAETVWWGDFVAITRRLLDATGINPADIAGIGCSAIAPAVLPVDADCRPLRPGGILYGVDTRAAAEIAELETALGVEAIFAKAGNALSAQSTGPKILWLKRHEPETYRQAYKFVTATSFLVARLTGNFVVDQLTGSFSVPLYDFQQRAYDDSLSREIVELDRLPELRWSTEIAGTVTPAAAAQTGLAAGTPVIVGASDAAAEAVSVGVTTPGQMMLMYGSTIFFIEALDKPITDERLWATPYLFEGTSALLAGMSTSGTLTRWLRDLLAPDLVQAEASASGGFQENAYTVLTREASATPPGSEGLVVLPYFSGERTPINDPRARGVYFGLTLAHTRAHLYRAALEGIGHGVRHHLDVMRSIDATPSEVIAVGGGTQSDLWLQVVSDICGVEQKVPAVVLGASYGDAFLAGLGVGLFDSPEHIHRWLKDARTVRPNRELSTLYEQYHQVYLRLYQQNKTLMHELTDLMQL